MRNEVSSVRKRKNKTEGEAWQVCEWELEVVKKVVLSLLRWWLRQRSRRKRRRCWRRRGGGKFISNWKLMNDEKLLYAVVSCRYILYNDLECCSPNFLPRNPHYMSFLFSFPQSSFSPTSIILSVCVIHT